MPLTLNRKAKRMGRFFYGGVAINSLADIATRDHDLLAGLADDDHTQYALGNKTRPATWVAAADLGGRSLADLGTRTHSLLTGLTADDHLAYLRLIVQTSALVDVVNTAVETDLANLQIPGGTLGTDGGLLILLQCDVLNNTGAGQFSTWRLRFGPGLIGVYSPNYPTSASRRSLLHTCWLFARGATNVQVATTLLLMGNAASGLDSAESKVDIPREQAVDSTIDQALRFSVQHAVANANLSARLHALRVYRLRP